MLVAVFALGACGGGSSDDASESTPNTASNSGDNNGGSSGSSGSGAACKLVTQADATKLFGVEAKAKENASPGDEASVCIWQADDAENHGFLLQVRVYDDEFHYGGDSDIFPNAETIAGLGDKAFVNKGQQAGTDVQFVKDGKTYVVNYGITNIMAEEKKLAADQADELVAIVKANSSNV